MSFQPDQVLVRTLTGPSGVVGISYATGEPGDAAVAWAAAAESLRPGRYRRRDRLGGWAQVPVPWDAAVVVISHGVAQVLVDGRVYGRLVAAHPVVAEVLAMTSTAGRAGFSLVLLSCRVAGPLATAAGSAAGALNRARPGVRVFAPTGEVNLPYGGNARAWRRVDPGQRRMSGSVWCIALARV